MKPPPATAFTNRPDVPSSAEPARRRFVRYFTWPAPADPTPMIELLQCPLLFAQQQAGVLVSHTDAGRDFYKTNSLLTKAFAAEANRTLSSVGVDHAIVEHC